MNDVSSINGQFSCHYSLKSTKKTAGFRRFAAFHRSLKECYILLPAVDKEVLFS
ncbi:hypothetical protein ACQKIC_14005 [Peribacillus sp. NPDC046944]